jgi:hypothetical protein
MERENAIKFWEPRERPHSFHHQLSRDEEIYRGRSRAAHIVSRFALSHDDIHLINLYIEAAAVEVIDWMCDNTFRSKQLLVEFDVMTFPDPNTRPRVKRATNPLLAAGHAF